MRFLQQHLDIRSQTLGLQHWGCHPPLVRQKKAHKTKGVRYGFYLLVHSGFPCGSCFNPYTNIRVLCASGSVFDFSNPAPVEDRGSAISYEAADWLVAAASCRPDLFQNRCSGLKSFEKWPLERQKSRGIDRTAHFWTYSRLYPGSLHGVSGGTLTGITFSASPRRICTPSADHGLTVFLEAEGL